MKDAEKAKAMIKAVYEDGEAEINGRKYAFTKMVHKDRRKVFAFCSRIQAQLAAGDFSFLDWPDFEPVEKVVNDHVLYNDAALSRLPTHWDKYPGDYLPFIGTALSTISYPFTAADSTG